jgi:hypothetical protein
MATDWDDVDKALDDAAKKTNDDLAGKVSSLTRLTDDEIKKLFPTKDDVAKLSQLMQIVRGATSQNEKVNALTENIEGLGKTVITLLAKLA